MLIVNSRIQIPLDELEFTYARSGGPGGQNVNKVNSKAILRWRFTSNTSVPQEVKDRFRAKYGSRLTTEGDLILTSTRYRDQLKNVEDCKEKLKELLLSVAERPIPRRKTKPTLGSVRRNKAAKQERSQRKQGRRAPSGDD